MAFKLSRCQTKKVPKSSADQGRARESSSKSRKRRKRSLPPIPCYKSYSQLEKMEAEFLRDDTTTLGTACPAAPCSPLLLSDDDDDAAAFHVVFSKGQPRGDAKEVKDEHPEEETCVTNDCEVANDVSSHSPSTKPASTAALANQGQCVQRGTPVNEDNRSPYPKIDEARAMVEKDESSSKQLSLRVICDTEGRSDETNSSVTGPFTETMNDTRTIVASLNSSGRGSKPLACSEVDDSKAKAAGDTTIHDQRDSCAAVENETASARAQCGRETQRERLKSTRQKLIANDEMSKAPKANPRKRARKGSCALCVTCPCNNLADLGDANGNMTVNTFARSDAAVEKALIRRVQKMEKSFEMNEGRLEVLRRKLKQHRREMWKKALNRRDAAPVGANHFLPDAQEFEEIAQMGSARFPVDSVQAVQKVVFPDVPCVQMTLTQMIGCSGKSKEIIEKGGSPQEVTAAALQEDSKGDALGRKDDEEEEDGEYVVYSTDMACEDRLKRIVWNASDLTGKASPPSSFSFWENLVKNSLSLSNSEQASTWNRDFRDDIIRSHDGAYGGGIDQLLGLFGASSEVEASTEYLEEPNNVINISDLSQNASKMAMELISSVERESSRLSSLEIGCPHWRENVTFAMKQSDMSEIVSALGQVRKRRNQMVEFKRRLLEAWETQDTVLNVYESALQSSLDRFDSPLMDKENIGSPQLQVHSPNAAVMG